MPYPHKTNDFDIGTNFACGNTDMIIYGEGLFNNVWNIYFTAEYVASWEFDRDAPVDPVIMRLRLVVDSVPTGDTTITFRWPGDSVDSTYVIDSNSFGLNIDGDFECKLYPDTIKNCFKTIITSTIIDDGKYIYDANEDHVAINCIVNNVKIEEEFDNSSFLEIGDSINIFDVLYENVDLMEIENFISIADETDTGVEIEIDDEINISETIINGFKFIKRTFTSINWRRIL